MRTAPEHVAKRYWLGCLDGGVNPSEADWALACKLAFYTGRNLEQMDRLFRQSELGKRPKAKTRRGSVDYARYTLERACRQQKAIWEPKKKVKKSRAPGRPPSESTCRVIALAAQSPDLKPREIAERLRLNPGTVRSILCRQRSATIRETQRRAA